MGNNCYAIVRKCFDRPSKIMPDMQKLSLMEMQNPNTSETYTQVSDMEDISFQQYTEEQLLTLPKSLEEAISQAQDMFYFRLNTTKDFEVVYQEEQLQIEFQSYQISRHTIVQLKYHFYIRCSLDDFLNFQYLDNLVQLVTLEDQSNTKLIYSSYKKMQFLDSREYLYMSHHSKTKNNKYLQVMRSVNMSYPSIATRGTIIVSGYLIQQQSDRLYIRAYSEVDFQLKLPQGMIKRALCLELKKVINQLVDNNS